MPSYGKDLNTAIKVFEVLREVDSEMPCQMAHVFLCVALRPGLTMQNLADATGLSQSSCSRNVQTLGKWHRIGKPGLDLVEAVEDPEDTRRKIMFLTKRGRDIAAKIVGQFNPGKEIDFEAKDAKGFLQGVYKARMARA